MRRRRYEAGKCSLRATVQCEAEKEQESSGVREGEVGRSGRHRTALFHMKKRSHCHRHQTLRRLKLNHTPS
jgi:hypothetical protein